MKHWKLWAIAILMTIMGVQLWMNLIQSAYLKTADQNIEALTDSIRVQENEIGQLESVKLALSGRISDIEQANESLAAEIAAEKGRVRTIIRTQTVVRNDTLRIPTETIVINDSTYQFRWDHSSHQPWGFRKLSGNSVFLLRNGIVSVPTTEITRDELSFGIVTGIQERPTDDRLEIFVRSEHPGVTFSSIEGALIERRDLESLFKSANKGRFGIGPSVSFGILPDGSLGLSAGIGINYNLIRF